MTQCICITISEAQSFINSKLWGIYFPCPGTANFKVCELACELHMSASSLSQRKSDSFNIRHGLDNIFLIMMLIPRSDSGAFFPLNF